MTRFQTLVLGASGYVGGECLRLVHGHPGLTLEAAVSESKAAAMGGGAGEEPDEGE